jgi:adenosylcobyric acid synthase
MVQGTASSVGKSLLVTMLCRYYARAGLRVAPFKSQNMALNSAVTRDGHEIGRAQYVQALAAGVEPSVKMNPILLKPEAERRAQVVVMGRPIGSFSAVEYHAHKPELKRLIVDCLEELRASADVVVIEGAGSPAEVNLKDRDIVNMAVAELADAPVLLVGDIDRGGVFAAFVGTLELLTAEERARVAALVVNKFRGDLALLTSGLDFLTERTKKPVLGVMPFLPALRIADEDSLSLEGRTSHGRPEDGVLDIVVVRLPRISNFDDFDPLGYDPGTSLRFVDRAEDILAADLVIVPGSKSTVSDLQWLRDTGLARALLARAREQRPILGICGGCQMLGIEISDPDRAESDQARAEGLGLLPIRTLFSNDKRTVQSRATFAAESLWTAANCEGVELSGYEIHMGRITREEGALPAFRIHARNGVVADDWDGAVGAGGRIAGSMLHGLFHNAPLRAALIERLQRMRGLVPHATRPADDPDAEFDRLALAVAEHLDCDLLRRIVGV